MMGSMIPGPHSDPRALAACPFARLPAEGTAHIAKVVSAMFLAYSRLVSLVMYSKCLQRIPTNTGFARTRKTDHAKFDSAPVGK
jgi:hypothetical protein